MKLSEPGPAPVHILQHLGHPVLSFPSGLGGPVVLITSSSDLLQPLASSELQDHIKNCAEWWMVGREYGKVSAQLPGSWELKVPGKYPEVSSVGWGG